MAIKTFTTGEVLTASDTNTYLANSGLVFVKSQTIGSAVTSVTVSDAFSATYDNYKIFVNSTGSQSQSLGIRIGGSTTGYYGFLIYGDISASTVFGFQTNNAILLPNIGGCAAASQASTATLEILNPFAASYTKMNASTYLDTGSFGQGMGEHRSAVSYTAFTIVVGAGTITGGTVTVYGYRKA